MQNPPPYGTPPPYGAPPPPDSKPLGLAPNVAGLLCYLPCCIGLIISIIILITEKVNRFARFHALQSLLLQAILFVLGLVLGVLESGMDTSGGSGLVFLPLRLAVGIGGLALTIWMMIKAHGGEMYKLPVIGDIAEKNAGGM